MSAMTLQHSPTPQGELVDGLAVDGLARTHWMIAICLACGHERVHGEQHHATCPACGRALRSFQLYRDLRAGG